MMLFLDGHDLRRLTMGLVEKDAFEVLETVDAAPETYLANVDRFLTTRRLRPEALEGISIVSGPGSFTSNRISLTIANTLHFVHGLPLFVLKNPLKRSPHELIQRFGVGVPVAQDAYARPFYAQPPHITAPTGGDKSLED